MVECCGSGKGVASEYCKNFAAVGQTTLVRKGLLKVTEQELEAIIAAKDNGLLPDYCRDDYIYLVDADGRPTEPTDPALPTEPGKPDEDEDN